MTTTNTSAYVILTDDEGNESLEAVSTRGMELFTPQTDAILISDYWLACTVMGAHVTPHARECMAGKFIQVFTSVEIDETFYIDQEGESQDSWGLLGDNEMGDRVFLGYIPAILVRLLKQQTSTLRNISVVKTGSVFVMSAEAIN